MPVEETMLQWQGHAATDSSGEKLGKIEDIYLDEESDKPEWALVSMGLFGGGSTLVPLAGATAEGAEIQVAFDKDKVKGAPDVLADQELSQEEEEQLYSYYGIGYSESRSDSAPPEAPAETGAVGRDTSGPTTDEAMTRSEEELRVGTASREVGRARLRKHIVSEQVQTTVPVRREEIRIDREPITEANAGAALDGPALSEEEHEVVLYEEEVVVDKRVVPKERVRLDKEVVVDEAQVSEEVRKEEVEIDVEERRA